MATDSSDESGNVDATPADSASEDELEPGVLADPLGDDDDDGGDASGESDGPGKSSASQALVPAPEQSLARTDPFRRYMSELRRYPPLSREAPVKAPLT